MTEKKKTSDTKAKAPVKKTTAAKKSSVKSKTVVKSEIQKTEAVSTGHIAQVMGAVVDVKFANVKELPAILTALECDNHGNKYRKNPDYKPEDRMYEINCQTCAPAYALRLRGFNVVAKGRTPGSKLEYLSQGRSFYVWKNADGTHAEHVSINSWLASKGYLRMSPKRYMEFFNEICREEGVYELVIGWKHGGGHATILQRFADGKLRYIEPQVDNSEGSGQEWNDIEQLCKKGGQYSHDCRGIMRIDNKLFDVDFIDIFDIGGV